MTKPNNLYNNGLTPFQASVVKTIYTHGAYLIKSYLISHQSLIYSNKYEI